MRLFVLNDKCHGQRMTVNALKYGGPYEGNIEEGMVLAIESYMGPIGESNGVKLEEQILVTKEGHEILSSYPFEESLLE